MMPVSHRPTGRVPQATATLPGTTTRAPWRGLYTLGALSTTPPEYGLSIVNWVATPEGLALRKGYQTWATNLPASVTSLLGYNARIDTSSKLFAVAGTAIYDVTSGGDMSSATPVVTGLSSSNAYWEYTNQTFSEKNYLVAVNGYNYPRLYDGTSWITASQVAVPASPGQFATVDNNGAAVNIQSWVDVCLHQQRLWFVQTNSTKAMYLDIAQVGGSLYAFDFGKYFPRGGYLLKLASWTIDSGNGTQSLLVAISNKGDVSIYQGTDPASASAFGLLGTYALGSPVGRRCTKQFQSDLMLLTQDGLFPMSKYLQSARLDATSAVTYNISNVISQFVTTYANQPGFEVVVYPSERVMLLNIPQTSQDDNFQYCFQTESKGWTQFTGWPARCFTNFNDALYFGGSDFVAIAFSGYKDGADINGAGGDNLFATALDGFNTFAEQGGLGMVKHAKMLKPFITSGQFDPSIQIGVNADFDLVPILGSATLSPVTGAVWNNGTWSDPGTTWAGNFATSNDWTTTPSEPGVYLAASIAVSATTDLLWQATQWLVVPGGQLG